MEQQSSYTIRGEVVPRLPIPVSITPTSPSLSPVTPSSGRISSQPIPIPGAKILKSPLPKCRNGNNECN